MNINSGIVQYHRPLGIVLCKKCPIYIRDGEGTVARHLRQVHDLKKNAIEAEISNCMEQKRNCDPLTVVEQEVRACYMKYYGEGSSSSSWKVDEILPELEALDARIVYQCKNCLEINANVAKAKVHRKECQTDFRAIRGQSLFSGNAARYFRVPDLDSGSGAWIVEDLDKMEVTEDDGVKVAQESEMDSFISVLRSQDLLNRYGLSLEQSNALCSWGESAELDKKVWNAMNSYIQDAINMYRSNVFVKTHTFMGNKLHIMLKSSTLSRYKTDMVAMFYFVHNVWKSRSETGSETGKVGGVMKRLEVDSVQLIEHCKWGENDNEVEVQHELHKLLKSLLFTHIGAGEQMVPLFVACKSVRKDVKDCDTYRFGTGTELSPSIAAMLYLVECTVVHEVYGIGATIDEMNGSNREQVDRWNDLLKTVDNHTDCGALYLRYCMNVCYHICFSEMSHIRFIVCGKHAKCAIVDGQELSIERLGACVRDVQQEMKQLLDEQLLLGFMKHLGSSFWADMQKMTDNFTDRAERGWFGSNEVNSILFRKWKVLFANHVVNVKFAGANGHLDVGKANRFLKSCERFCQTMFWLLQVTSGGPARASELSSIQFRNGQFANRHLFLLQGRLFYVLFYHKGRDKTGGPGKPIARFPDVETSNLLLLYLLFSRSLESIVVYRLGLGPKPDMNEVGENAVKRREDMFVFASRGCRFSESQLRRSFSRHMKRTGADMNGRQYRQYHAGVVKNFFKTQEESGVVELNSTHMMGVMHAQTGHSIRTANERYGVSDMDMRKLDASQLEKFRSVSYMWHAQLGIETGQHREVVPATTVGENLAGSGAVQCNIELSQMLRRVDSKLDRLLELFTDVSSKPGEQPNTKKRRVQTSQFTEDEVLEVLLRLIGRNGIETFKNEEQKKSLLMVMNSKKDGLIISPTGSGKSMHFLIPAFLRSADVSILIVPLVALQMDIIKKCKRYGVQAELWKDRFTAGARIVLCSVEHVVTETYKLFISEKQSLGTLFAVFVDEALLVKQWSSFRPVLNRIRRHIKPEGVKFPVYAMTGTCPPIMSRNIMDALNMNMNEATVMRSSCTRSNISYRMVDVDEEDVQFELASIIRSNAKKVRSESKLTGGKFIVYCLTRDSCDQLPDEIQGITGRTVSLYKYHAGLSGQKRKEQAEQWERSDSGDQVHVMFATAAFGCGIDIANVRLVVHSGCPHSMIGYVQESGRAGRDGRPCQSIVLNIRKQQAQKVRKHGAQMIMSHDDGGRGEGEGWTEDSEEQHLEIWSAQQKGQGMFGDMKSWIKLGRTDCRRWMLDNYCDGVNDRRSCLERNMEPCDLCEGRKSAGKEKAGFSRSFMKSVTTSNAQHPQNADKTPTGVRPTRIEDNMPIGSGNAVPFTERMYAAELVEHESMIIEDMMARETQSQSVTPSKLTELSVSLDNVCAVCSIKQRKKVRHTDGKDEQKCKAYKGHCLRCSSNTHKVQKCFMENFKGTAGQCYSCSFSIHGNDKIHPVGTYGNRKCPNKNGIRLITTAFENADCRKLMEKRFPAVCAMNSNEEVVKWLRLADEKGHTWYADALVWIEEHVLEI